MKRLLLFLAAATMLLASGAPVHKDIILAQFNRTQGDWDGFMEYTDFSDNKTKYAMPARCTTKFDGSIWTYDVQYDEGNGDVVAGGGECVLNDDGSKMNNNGVVWNITDVIQSGDTVRVVMQTTGKDNRKKATMQQTFQVTSNTFQLIEEVKYLDSQTFFVRNKHLFRKKK